ncbi:MULTISPECIES: hypothetical protein [Paenibacillus]|uniref:hypothetical protein n=1 Tax=Paenibacillus TaxID=44249 RepID=UPI0011A85094|nr:hypothetical protein [Paenibacillus sp. IHBB 10380]
MMKSEHIKDLKQAIHNKHNVAVFLNDNKNILGVPEESTDLTRIKIRISEGEVIWIPKIDIKHLSVVVEFSEVGPGISDRGGNCAQCGLELNFESQSDDYPAYCDNCVNLLGFNNNKM